MNYRERLEALIKRRNIDLSDIKYRGKLRTVKWNVYEAASKNQLLSNLTRGLREL